MKNLKEYHKYLEDNYRGWGDDVMADYDEDQGFVAEAAYDTAKCLLDDQPEVTKILKKAGVTDVLGRLADDLYSVAFEK